MSFDKNTVEYNTTQRLLEQNYTLNNENTETTFNVKLKRKLKYLKDNLSAEPVFAGFIIPSMLSRIAIQNLNLDKACRVKLNFGTDICDSLIKHSGANLSIYEKEVQSVVSAIEAWKSVILTAIPILLLIFLGAWSDKTGNRKLPILLPIFGELLLCISNVISTYFFYEIPIELTMFFEAILPAVSGGWVVIFLGVYSYVSEITDEKNRTFRLGILNFCMTAGIPIGTALSGILLKLIGYYGIFVTSGTIYFLTLWYGFYNLETNTKRNACDNEDKQRVDGDFINLVKDTVKVAYKPRQSGLRTKVILTLFVVGMAHGPSQGEGIITYMYVRYKLNWDAVKYSIYCTYLITSHSFGVLITMAIFDKKLGFHDSLLCLISIVSKLAGSIMVAFVKTDTEMFMVPIVEMLNSTILTTLRSISSKLVEKEEIGKMNSLFGLVEAIAAMFFNPVYSRLYLATLNVFPGTVFLFSAAMTIPIIIVMILFYIQHRRTLTLK